MIIVAVSDGERACCSAAKPHGRHGGYSVVAGSDEPGESLEQTVVREVFEETRACACAVAATSGRSRGRSPAR